jgi:putative peptidoglycan lipid II flippase
LPAYVLIKVLTPGFYARKDMKTPVYIALAMLVLGVALNFALIPILGIAALALTTAASAWLNALALYVILHARRHYRIPGLVWWRIAKQLFAAAIMAAALFLLQEQLDGLFTGSASRRIVGVGALVGVGAGLYFGITWVIHAFDREEILALFRRKRGQAAVAEAQTDP